MRCNAAARTQSGSESESAAAPPPGRDVGPASSDGPPAPNKKRDDMCKALPASCAAKLRAGARRLGFTRCAGRPLRRERHSLGRGVRD